MFHKQETNCRGKTTWYRILSTPTDDDPQTGKKRKTLLFPDSPFKKAKPKSRRSRQRRVNPVPPQTKIKCGLKDPPTPIHCLVVKSISLSALAPPTLLSPEQVHEPAARSPHAHELDAAGLTFSVAALSQEHWRAGFAPQEQVAC